MLKYFVYNLKKFSCFFKKQICVKFMVVRTIICQNMKITDSLIVDIKII